MRTLLKLVAVFVGLLVLVVIGAYWYLSTLDISEYREEIAAKVKEVTGRELQLAGEMELRAFPSPSLVVEDVSLANADWATQSAFVRIKRVEAEVSLAELFAGKVTISRIAVIDPKIVLEIHKSGRNNWTFGSGARAEAKPSDDAAPLGVDVSNVEVRGGEISYFDGVNMRTAKIGIDKLLVTAAGWGRPMEIDLVGAAAISNVAWGSQPDFINIGRLEAKISMSDWSGSDLKVERLVAERPVVFLETDANGQNNWTFAGQMPSGESAPSAEKPLAFDVRVVEVREGKFSFRDGAADTTREIVVEALTVNTQDADQTLDIALKASVDNRAFSVNGRIGSLAALFDNKPYSFDVKVAAGSAEVNAAGKLQKPMDVKGVEAKLSMKAPKLSELMNVFGSSSDLALPLEASASIRDVDDGYRAENLNLTLGKSDLSGDVSYLTNKARPQIKSALQSKLLDLDEFSSDKEKKKSDRLIPADPLPVDTLRAVDAEISFKGAQVISSGMVINALTLDMKLRNGRLELIPGAGLYGGQLGGRVALDAAVDQPRFDTDLKGQQINLGALVNDINKSDMLSGGSTDLSVKLEGRGATPRDIAASANGLVLANIGAGKIHTSVVEKIGADAVMQAFRAASGEEDPDYTGFQCGVARFVVKKGQAVADKGIGIESARMNVVGTGTVDLGTEAVDIAIKTEPKEGAGLSVSSVGLAVRVGGTLANPKTSLDSLGTAKAGASAAAAVATGGLSLLAQGLLSRAAADDAPCDTARGIKRKKAASGTTSTAASKETQESGGSSSGSSGAADTVTDTLKGVGDKLKGLFGN